MKAKLQKIPLTLSFVSKVAMLSFTSYNWFQNYFLSRICIKIVTRNMCGSDLKQYGGVQVLISTPNGSLETFMEGYCNF